MEEYKIIGGRTESLADEVNRLIKEGWRLTQPIGIVPPGYDVPLFAVMKRDVPSEVPYRT